jgi:hypothetical protein
VGLFALRDPNAEIDRYRSQLAETIRTSNAKMAKLEAGYINSQKELLATQKSLIATENALTNNINALRQLQTGNPQPANESSEITVPVIHSGPSTPTTIEAATNLRNIHAQLLAVQSGERQNLLALRDNAESLAKSKFDLAEDSATLEALKNPKSASRQPTTNRKWQDYMLPADVPLLTDSTLDTNPGSSGSVAQDNFVVPSDSADALQLTSKLTSRLSRAEAQLTETESRIGKTQEQLLDCQSKLKDVRAEIVTIVSSKK